MFFLMRPGRANLCEQIEKSFSLGADASGRKYMYVYQNVDALDKTHRQNDDPSDSITDARVTTAIKSFEFCLLKLNKRKPELW